MSQLFDLAGDAASDVLQNHPQLKEKVGGSYDQLKQMGDAYGPKAKEEVDKTWKQISDIIKGGVSVDSADKIRSLIEDKKNKLQSLGDEAWQKGLEESQSYLEKNPKLKQLIEENADTLKKGNFKDLWGLVKEKVPSGKTEDVENYIKEKVDQAKNSDFSGLDQWLNKVPGGSDLMSQLQSLQSTAQKKGNKSEDILKETLEELRDVLKKRMEQVEKLAQE
jgi:gas vesicle protein